MFHPGTCCNRISKRRASRRFRTCERIVAYIVKASRVAAAVFISRCELESRLTIRSTSRFSLLEFAALRNLSDHRARNSSSDNVAKLIVVKCKLSREIAFSAVDVFLIEMETEATSSGSVAAETSDEGDVDRFVRARACALTMLHVSSTCCAFCETARMLSKNVGGLACRCCCCCCAEKSGKGLKRASCWNVCVCVAFRISANGSDVSC